MIALLPLQGLTKVYEFLPPPEFHRQRQVSFHLCEQWLRSLNDVGDHENPEHPWLTFSCQAAAQGCGLFSQSAVGTFSRLRRLRLHALHTHDGSVIACLPTSLTSLEASGVHLAATTPQHFTHLTSLTHLSLPGSTSSSSADTCAEIVEVCNGLPRLLALGLANRQAEECEWSSLAQLTDLQWGLPAVATAHLTSLTNLDLGDSAPGSLDDPRSLTGLCHLTKLNLSGALGPSLLDVRFLEKLTGTLADLNLSSNGLGDNAMLSVGRSEKLTCLNVAENALSGYGINALTSWKNLTSLDLSSNPLADADITELCRELSSLRYLNMNHMPSELDAVLEGLVKVTTLTSLELRQNTLLSQRGLICLFQHRALRRLTLEFTRVFRSTRGEVVAAAAAEARLRELDLSHSSFGKELAVPVVWGFRLACDNCSTAVEAMFPHLPCLGALEELYLSHNATALHHRGTAGLSALTSLTLLHLHHNRLRPSEVQFLRHVTALSELGISHNEIALEGVRTIGSRLTRLTYLDIQANFLRAEAVFALRGLTRLKSLMIGANCLRGDSIGGGFRELLLLLHLTRLTYLDVSSGGCGGGGAGTTLEQELERGLPHLRQLKW